MPARIPTDASDPDVAIVLDAYAAFARGDAEAAVAAMDEQVEWIEPESFAMGGRRVGPEAVAEYLAASRAGWKHLTSEPTPYRVGGEIVIVHELRGILQDGTALEASATDVFRLRGGRVVLMRAYEQPEEAFADAPARAWIDAYVEAWNSNDPGQIGALFTPDGEYWSEPWEVWRGHRRRLARARRRARRVHLRVVGGRPRRRPLDRRSPHRLPAGRPRLRQPLAAAPRRRGPRGQLQRVVEADTRRRRRVKRPSRRIRLAALWPGAPITPPPGWVPAPQR